MARLIVQYEGCSDLFVDADDIRSIADMGLIAWLEANGEYDVGYSFSFEEVDDDEEQEAIDELESM